MKEITNLWLKEKIRKLIDFSDPEFIRIDTISLTEEINQFFNEQEKDMFGPKKEPTDTERLDELIKLLRQTLIEIQCIGEDLESIKNIMA